MDLVITLERINTPFSASCPVHIFLWACSSFAMYFPFSVPGTTVGQESPFFPMSKEAEQLPSAPSSCRLSPPRPPSPCRTSSTTSGAWGGVCAEHNPTSAFPGAEEEREKVEETQHQAESVPSKRRLLSGGNPADNPALQHRAMPGGAIKQNSEVSFRQTQLSALAVCAFLQLYKSQGAKGGTVPSRYGVN